MPVVLDPPPIQCAAEASLLYALDNAPSASGSDGLELMKQYWLAYRHSQDRPSMATADAVEEEALRHVPFRKVGTIRVRFKSPTPMKPRTVDFEVGETE